MGCKCKSKVKVYFAGEEGVKIPTKRESDAGYDVYAYFEEVCMMIKPHETVMIPTGLHSSFPDDYVMVLHERGSTGTRGIGQRSGVIDSGYRGEWMVPITNHNEVPLFISKVTREEVIEKLSEDYPEMPKEVFEEGVNQSIIYPYTKAICQALLLPVPKVEIEELPLEELKAIPSERGEGKLGSSGK